MRGPITFHPTPGSPASLVAIHGAARPWDALRECLASDLGCDEGALDLEDVYWADDSADVVTLDGEIIGAIGRELTAAEVDAINGETEPERRAA